MTQYAVLLFTPAPGDVADMPPEELEAHGRQEQIAKDLGISVVSAYALQPSTTATSIRGDVVTDGPFIEAKEVVAGFFVIEARDLDHALELVKQNPATWRGGVEVRPLFGPPEE
jgi:hypothetical protein